MIKDEEIDLTEHRDFNDNSSPTINIGDRIGRERFVSYITNRINKQIYGEDIPWNVYPLIKYYKYDGLIALGNKEERMNAITSQAWGTLDNEICDCCGEKYIKIPWNVDSGLCIKCQNEMNKNKNIVEF